MVGELAPQLGLVSALIGLFCLTDFAARTVEMSVLNLPVRQQFAHAL